MTKNFVNLAHKVKQETFQTCVQNFLKPYILEFFICCGFPGLSLESDLDFISEFLFTGFKNMIESKRKSHLQTYSALKLFEETIKRPNIEFSQEKIQQILELIFFHFSELIKEQQSSFDLFLYQQDYKFKVERITNKIFDIIAQTHFHSPKDPLYK